MDDGKNKISNKTIRERAGVFEEGVGKYITIVWPYNVKVNETSRKATMELHLKGSRHRGNPKNGGKIVYNKMYMKNIYRT